MIAKCVFNPLRDVEETIPELAADIAEIMATGTVASTGTLQPFSKETEISEVGHYLRDKIQTVMAARALKESISRQASSTVSPSSPSQVAQPAQPGE